MLVVVKVLAQNSGLDPQESIVKLQEEYTGPKQAVGLDIKTGQYRPKCVYISRMNITKDVPCFLNIRFSQVLGYILYEISKHKKNYLTKNNKFIWFVTHEMRPLRCLIRIFRKRGHAIKLHKCI